MVSRMQWYCWTSWRADEAGGENSGNFKLFHLSWILVYSAHDWGWVEISLSIFFSLFIFFVSYILNRNYGNTFPLMLLWGNHQFCIVFLYLNKYEIWYSPKFLWNWGLNSGPLHWTIALPSHSFISCCGPLFLPSFHFILRWNLAEMPSVGIKLVILSSSASWSAEITVLYLLYLKSTGPLQGEVNPHRHPYDSVLTFLKVLF